MIKTTSTRLKFAGRLRREYRRGRYLAERGTYSSSSYSGAPRPFDTISSRLERAADPGIDAWFMLSVAKDYESAEEAALSALEADPGSRFARSALAEIYAFQSRFDEAIRQIEAARRHHPRNKWYRLTHADLLTEGKHLDEAVSVLKDSETIPDLRRHVYKRLSRISYRLGNLPAALYWQERLVSLAPNYLVYVSDYLFLAWLEVKVLDDFDAALRTLEAGSEIYKRSAAIRRAAEGLRRGRWVGDEPWDSWPAADSRRGDPAPSRKEPVVTDKHPGVARLAIPTPLVTMHSDFVALIDAATASVREPSDIVAVSESVLAISQGRAIPLELVDAGPLARLLCKFVHPEGPLHSPQGMQGAVAEAGAARILLAALGSGLGKLAGAHGLFYRIAGPRSAMIDDVAACMPPFDHHLILGPADPDGFSEAAASALGCRVCVVDANNKTGAWIIGASSGIDRAVVESVLSDNPAGNEDEQTPVVLIKGL